MFDNSVLNGMSNLSSNFHFIDVTTRTIQSLVPLGIGLSIDPRLYVIIKDCSIACCLDYRQEPSKATLKKLTVAELQRFEEAPLLFMGAQFLTKSLVRPTSTTLAMAVPTLPGTPATAFHCARSPHVQSNRWYPSALAWALTLDCT